MRFKPLTLAVLLAGAFALSARADETCNSPYLTSLIKGQEDYVYVWALGVEGRGDGSDKLVTVDVNPKSKRYGKVLHSVSTGARAEAHHMGFTDDRRHIWAGGLSESRIWVFDIATDPAKPAARVMRICWHSSAPRTCPSSWRPGPPTVAWVRARTSSRPPWSPQTSETASW